MPERPNFFYHLHPPKIPSREGSYFYTFGLGGLSVFLFIILGITGALELLYYVPSGAEANSSLQAISLFVPYGKLIRSLHFWAAQAMVATVVLHMLRVLFTGAYKPPRSFNWLLGLSLLVVTLFFDFTGYGLRWDLDIAWALMVGTNLLKSIPFIGDTLYGVVVGGSEIGHPTIVRFYGWHIYGLSIIGIFLISWHVFRVRRDGGISSADTKSERPKNIPRSVLVRRELFVAIIASIVLLIISTFFPPSLGPKANFESLPEEAVAPWFFLWIQQLLRWGSPFLMGVLVPLAVLVTLALVPYVLDRSTQGVATWFHPAGRRAQITLILIAACILALTIIGILH